MVGTIVGNYQIVEKIGEGGMGAIYKCVDLMLERTVAIKVLRSELTDDASIVERFRREAKALARLNHPNITGVYNFFTHNNEYLIVLEYIDGQNLEQILAKKGKVSYENAYQTFSQITNALSFAHQQGIVHRDIKPANIMETADGKIKVTDFGIARILGAKALTQIGRGPGSAYYASPEQIHALEDLDARSDIYSLGILLFQVLSGTLPFLGTSLPEILQKQLVTPAPPISGYLPTVSPVVEAVIKKSLAKKPEDRFATVEEFFRALPSPNANKISLPTDFKQTVGSKPITSTQVSSSRPAQIASLQPQVNQNAGAKPVQNHIRLTDSRFTVQLEPQQQILPAARPRPKKSRLGKIAVALALLLLFTGLGAFALFYFVVQPNLNLFR
ncbi:MAG: serine/threonine-protein kinase [Pyrinomonadaceae bacterium]